MVDLPNEQVLYESRFDAQFIIISDGFKRSVGYSDAFPANIKLEKGSYTLRLQVRHDSVAVLEPLKGMALTLERKLASSVLFACYWHRRASLSFVPALFHIDVSRPVFLRCCCHKHFPGLSRTLVFALTHGVFPCLR